MEQVPYSHVDDMQISSDSVEKAAKKVIDYLETQGLLTALIANKFNV